MSRRLLLLLASLAVALVALLAVTGRTGSGLSQLPLHDFVEYWAAGQLLAAGENPYDLESIEELEKQAGRTDPAILMWNPPWTLPLVLPLGWMPVRVGHLVWLGVHFLAILLSADLLWRHYGGDPARRFLAPLLAFSFVPTLSALIIGQISPLLLLGASAFLVLNRARWEFAAGAVTALMAIKPHMTYLFWVALLVWAWGTRRWRLLLGGVLTGVLLTALTLAYRPGILGEYWQTARQTPAQYAPPTLGYLIRWALDSPHFGWQFLPVIPGLAWLAWYGRRHGNDWDWSRHLPPLLLASALTAAYGAWLFDLVLLLVPVLQIAARMSRQGSLGERGMALGVHLGMTAVGLWLMLVPRQVQYLHYMWITPVLLLSYLILSEPRSYHQQIERPIS